MEELFEAAAAAATTHTHSINQSSHVHIMMCARFFFFENLDFQDEFVLEFIGS
jgi:hypothetical protein